MPLNKVNDQIEEIACLDTLPSTVLSIVVGINEASYI